MIRTMCIIAALAAAALSSGASSNTTASVSKGLPVVHPENLPKLKLDKLPVTSSGQRIAARVNGIPIYEKSLLFGLDEAMKAPQDSKVPAEAIRASLARPVVDQLCLEELVMQYARNEHMSIPESDIDAWMIAENKKRPPGDKLQDAAVRSGLSEQELRDSVRRRLTREKVFQRIGSYVAEPTAAQIDELRKKFPYAITTGTEEVRISQIAINARDKASSAVLMRARSRAEQALLKLRGGASFAAVAKEYSQDTASKNRDGDLGYFIKGKLYPTFEEVAFRLKPGEISNVVETPVGFHIIKVTERWPDNAHSTYMDMQKRKAFEDWRQKTWKEAKVQVYF